MAKILGSITVFPAQAGVIPDKQKQGGDKKSLSRASGGDPYPPFMLIITF